MRKLFDMDRKDYDPNGKFVVRPSVRGIVIRDGKLAMVHSLKYDYYKYPGGGIDPGESLEDTLIREVREEAGLPVIPHSIQEFGMVHRVQKGVLEEIFIQDNYYFLCDVEDTPLPQSLDDYEAEERFTLEWVKPEQVIRTNLAACGGPKNPTMLMREVRVLEILMQEGYL